MYRGGSGWSNGTAEAALNMRWQGDGDLDALRLRYRETGSTQHTFSYTYNAAGQLTSEGRDTDWSWAAANAQTIAYDPANTLDQYTAVADAALTYDANGNRASYAGLTTLHDAENRLVAAMTASMNVVYRYDAAGRRVGKDFASGAYTDTATAWAGDMAIAEYDASGTLLRRFIPGIGVDNRVAMITCGAGGGTCPNAVTHYYIADRLGHVIAMIDSAGNLADRYIYTPYGVQDPLTASGNPYRYTGRYYDAETELFHYRARYYDPEHGRFLETDPVGYADQMNLYGYVGNDPLNATDPSGLFCKATRIKTDHGTTCGGSGGKDVGAGNEDAPGGAPRGPEGQFLLQHTSTRPGVVTLKDGSRACCGDVAYTDTPVTPELARLFNRTTIILAGAGPGSIRVVSTRLGAASFAGRTRGAHIVLGYRSGLPGTAANVGGQTLLRDPNWRTTFLHAISNPNTRFTLSLDGLRGSGTVEKILAAASRGSTPSATATEWEISVLYQSGRLGTVQFVEAGGTRIIANPFAMAVP